MSYINQNANKIKYVFSVLRIAQPAYCLRATIGPLVPLSASVFCSCVVCLVLKEDDFDQ